MKKYNIKILYKNNVNQPFFEENFPNRTEEATKKIEAKYSKYMTDGYLVACFIYITEA
jgi:hypothetical protein